MEESELKAIKEEAFAHLERIAEGFHGEDVYSEKFASKRKNLIEEFQFMTSLFIKLDKKTTVQKCVQFRKDVAQMFIDLKLLNIISKIVIEYPLCASDTSDEENQLLQMALNLLLNYADESDALANAVAKTEVMESCKTFLQIHSQQYVEDKLTDFENEIVNSCITVVQNVSLRNVNLERLRSLNLTKVLEQYLKTSDEEISMLALTILANILKEEECYVIESHALPVARLLSILKKCILSNDRRHSGWSCMELAHAVRNLARNDSIKKLLWNLNAVQILVEIATKGSDDEILESVNAIWVILFDEEIRKNITVSRKGKGVVELLLKLQDPSVDSSIRNLSSKTLWRIKKVPWVSTKEASRTSASTHKAGERRHIMISYQTSNRDVILQIKEALTKQNYKVWIDVCDITGSTLDAMAEAVENAAIVLMCYSRSYKESDNCRLEAEYAHECKKPIVPLKMEANYKPDGWLGLLIGSKLYVDFTGKYEFGDRLKILFEEIQSIKTQGRFSESSPVRHEPVDETDAAPVVSNKRHEKKDESSVIATIRQWKRDDVVEWLTRYNLTEPKLEMLTGDEIAYMVTMQEEAPEQLHDCIRNDLQIKTLLVKAKVVLALRDLPWLLKTSKVTTNAEIS